MDPVVNYEGTRRVHIRTTCYNPAPSSHMLELTLSGTVQDSSDRVRAASEWMEGALVSSV